jgi:hypothetical protein
MFPIDFDASTWIIAGFGISCGLAISTEKNKNAGKNSFIWIASLISNYFNGIVDLFLAP